MLKGFAVGNLGADPEMRYTAQGEARLRFRIASNDRRRGQDGEYHDVTTWISVTVLGQRAEGIEKYLHKGDRIFVEGKISVRPWISERTGEPDAGLEILAGEIQFMTPRENASGDRQGGYGGQNGYGPQNQQQRQPARSGGGYGSNQQPQDDDLEDIPF